MSQFSNDFEITNPDSKMYSARAALDWLLADLSPSEVAILLRDYVNRNHTLTGSIYSQSVIRDMIFIKLTKEHPEVSDPEHEADALSEILVNSLWWKANDIVMYENHIIDDTINELMKDPKSFSEKYSYNI